MRPLALVTDASRGIGVCFAQQLAADGYDLVLVARDEAALKKVAAQLKTTSHVLVADLSDPEAPRRLAEQLTQRELQVDLLVNNAGFGTFGPFAKTDAEASREMLEVNVLALTLLTRALLPGMIARGRGAILNVASSAAFQPGPLMAAYYASKAYVLSFTEALAVELSGTGVTASVLCPGPTHSSFATVAGVPPSALFDRSRFEDPAEVAAAGIEGLRRGQVVVITGWMNRVRTFGLRFLPRSVVARMVERMQRPTLQLPARTA
jgi:short-subunit dehydrogenase